MNRLDQRVAVSIFRPIHQLEEANLIDFNCFINQDIKIINSTSHLYHAKTSECQKKYPIKLTTQQDAAQGNAPQPIYELAVCFKRQDNFDDIKYFSKFCQKKISGIPHFFQIKDLSFIALHKNGQSNQIKSYKIVAGDIIKLGNVVFRVNESHLSDSKNQNIQKIDKQVLEAIPNQISDSSNKCCRICLMESGIQEDSDQLISICKCKGSCKYVHASCLKTWINSKVQKQEGQCVVSYSLNKMQCEICKKKLSSKIKVRQEIHNLIQLQKPQGPYIILQKISEQTQNKGLYVLNFKKQKINIGRGLSNHLRFIDISISRIHASIVFDGCDFILNDQGSKYGTLILANKQIQIRDSINILFKSKLYKFERINSQKIRL